MLGDLEMVKTIKDSDKLESDIREAVDSAYQDGFVVKKIVHEGGFTFIYFVYDEDE